MTGFAITDTDFGIGALVVIVLAYLIYRLFRREPIDRLIRLGVFMERERIDNGEKVTERQEWPKRKPDE